MSDQHDQPTAQPGAPEGERPDGHVITTAEPSAVGPLRLEVHAVYSSTGGDLHLVIRSFYAPNTEGHAPPDAPETEDVLED